MRGHIRPDACCLEVAKVHLPVSIVLQLAIQIKDTPHNAYKQGLCRLTYLLVPHNILLQAWVEAAPAGTQVPVDGSHNEGQDDSEHEADAVVVGAAPVRDEVLLQQQPRLRELRLRVGALEVQVLAALRRYAQPGNQILVLPAGAT